METATSVTSLAARPAACAARAIRATTSAYAGGGEAISDSFWTLARTAAFLGRRARLRKSGPRKVLPSLLFFTDPQRTADPEAVARRLPRGAAVVYRAFGAADAPRLAARLAAIARKRGLVLLIGADPALARRAGAQGVHLPERLAHRARGLKARNPRWTVTAAAHSAAAARHALACGADAVVVSTVFASRSASAGVPMGPIRLAILVRRAKGPVYALGGVTHEKARLLKDAGVVGLAAVDAFTA